MPRRLWPIDIALSDVGPSTTAFTVHPSRAFFFVRENNIKLACTKMNEALR